MIELLCSKIMKVKYSPKSNIWEAKYRKGSSWFWKEFMEGVNFINQKAFMEGVNSIEDIGSSGLKTYGMWVRNGI